MIAPREKSGERAVGTLIVRAIVAALVSFTGWVAHVVICIRDGAVASVKGRTDRLPAGVTTVTVVVSVSGDLRNPTPNLDRSPHPVSSTAATT